MPNTVQVVSKLSDIQVIKMVKQIEETIADAISPDELEEHADPGALKEVKGATAGDAEQLLPPAVSLDVSRRVLLALASDPATAPLVEQAWAVVEEDDSLFIEAIIALGLIANLTLFMATTKVKFKVGTLEIDKGDANVEMIKAALQPLTLSQSSSSAPDK